MPNQQIILPQQEEMTESPLEVTFVSHYSMGTRLATTIPCEEGSYQLRYACTKGQRDDA
jgi:hypothetical protein